MIPVLAIPHFNRPDLLVRCITSIDFAVENLAIVQNGPDQFMPDITIPKSVKNMILIKHPNAGVAGAWNEVIKLFPADYWLISNNDIQFAPGDLKKMHRNVTAHPEAGCFCGNHGFSWFTITSRAVVEVGLFDENLYPAYLEDCDWCRRAYLVGLKRLTIKGVSSVHGDEHFTGSCTIYSDSELRRKNGITHGRNFEYYRKKWGGNNDHEVYRYPFNDPHWPIQHWVFLPEFRKGQMI